MSKASTAQHAEAPVGHMCTWPMRYIRSINPAGAIGCSGTVTAAAASHSSGSAKDAQATAAGSVAPSPPKLVQPAHFGLPIAANAWSNVNSNSKVTAACTLWPGTRSASLSTHALFAATGRCGAALSAAVSYLEPTDRGRVSGL